MSASAHFAFLTGKVAFRTAEDTILYAQGRFDQDLAAFLNRRCEGSRCRLSTS